MAMSKAGRKIWEGEIAKAKELIAWADSHPGEDCGDNYGITLDPEDFLDLLAGKWDA